MLHFHQLLYALFCIKFRSSRASLWLGSEFIRLALKSPALKSNFKNIFLPSKPITFETTPLKSKAITSAGLAPCSQYMVCQLQEFQHKSTHLNTKKTHVHVAWSQEHMLQTVPFHSRTLLELDYIFQESKQPQLKFFIPLKPDPMVKVKQLKFRAFFNIQPCN